MLILVFIVSSPIPVVKETPLFAANVEPTNEGYATAKMAGINLCQAMRKQYGCNFISGSSANVYDTNDNDDLQNSHVFPALMRRFMEAKENLRRLGWVLARKRRFLVWPFGSGSLAVMGNRWMSPLLPWLCFVEI